MRHDSRQGCAGDAVVCTEASRVRTQRKLTIANALRSADRRLGVTVRGLGKSIGLVKKILEEDLVLYRHLEGVNSRGFSAHT
ncbi:hypothetical protein MA16_Dca018440 [Dendrobium catenatum]|uniref:Uncharacterized protein n=1 Tax=Dendrobium catenatum TaxID=906689 RepID=A0A2I0XF99_9ASPA|nr:hypothetical protein MA16_Dca018440 [Dendrobium catenatum]